MKKYDSKIFLPYMLILIYVISVASLGEKITANYTYLINPLFWIATATITFLIFSKEKTRFKANKDKLQLVFICSLILVITFFLSGIIFGFTKNIYSLKFINILKNIWGLVLILGLKEFTRSKIILNSGNKGIYLIITTFLFILVDLPLSNMQYYLVSSETFFKFFFSNVFPIIAINILCTYLSCVSSFASATTYRVAGTIIKIVVPIQPALDWFMLGMFEGLFPLVTYSIVNYYNTKKTSFESRRKIKKEKPIYKITMVVMIVLLGLFVGGFLAYKPVAVMSGSMEPIYYRGDVVIVEKIAQENVKNLKKYDIIEYRIEGKLVLHRIMSIREENGKLFFTTKGDNNNANDNYEVTEDLISGKVLFTVKYLGYPSVLLYDYFNK